MKHVLLWALSRSAPHRFFDLLEGLSAQVQGKGWGNDSIKEEVDACLSVLGQSPRIFIDIGANFGDYADEILKRHPSTECHLFEPSTSCSNKLKQRFSSYGGVIINKFALGDHETRGSLYAPNEGSAYASLSERRMSHHNINMLPLEEVSVARFDSYWNDDRIIDYVKIDVEGHESKVLEGFGSRISKVRLIQFEFGSAHIDTRTYFQDFWYFFQGREFKIYRITPAGPKRIIAYKDRCECFSTTNYIAVNQILADGVCR